MTDTINDALECADRADAAARLRGEETTHGSRVLRRLVADLEAARAELARVTPGEDVIREIENADVLLHEDGGMPASTAWIAAFRRESADDNGVATCERCGDALAWSAFRNTWWPCPKCRVPTSPIGYSGNA